MDEQELMQQLEQEYKDGYVTKGTASKVKEFYNQHHDKDEWCTYCMCNAAQRKVWGRKFLEWYEGRD